MKRSNFKMGTRGAFPNPPATRTPERRGGEGGGSVPKSPEGMGSGGGPASAPRVFMAPLRRMRWALVAAVCLLACNAPFIPVPPPDNTFMSELITDGSGNSRTFWVTQGKPDSRASLATFYIVNDTRGTGVIVERANADGTYTAPPFEGASGDHIFIHYVTLNNSESETVCRQLVEGDPAPICSQ